MGNTSLQHKTIRPGSLNGYSYYYSGRKPATAVTTKPAGRSWRRRHAKMLVLVAVLAAAGLGFASQNNNAPASSNAPAVQTTPIVTEGGGVRDDVNYCEGNDYDKLIKVSVDKRHLWACEGTKTVQDTPIITGLRGHAETETPVGTYKIYAKQTNTTLRGNDSRGSWNYPVHYWMPFLDNQYGTYGFHDATWRAANAFGNISPDSQEASHGCVELPLAAQKWLYDWAPTGTTLTVES